MNVYIVVKPTMMSAVLPREAQDDFRVGTAYGHRWSAPKKSSPRDLRAKMTCLSVQSTSYQPIG
jgi:hypothetical protein